MSRIKNTPPKKSADTPHLSLSQSNNRSKRALRTRRSKATAANTSRAEDTTSFAYNFRQTWRKMCRFLKKSYRAFMRSLTNWLDPRLEPYREKKQTNRKLSPSLQPNDALTMTDVAAEIDHETAIITDANYRQEIAPTKNTPYTPQTTNEFLALLQRTPHTVLSPHERQTISTIINFPNYHVSDLMLPPKDIVYIKENELLGPVTLDRLYRSGFSHFPVTNTHGKIIGLLHTTALNSLEIRETSTAGDLLDPKVYYIRADYNLNQALAAFLRTNCYFFLVVDKFEHIIGMLTYQLLISFLLGESPADGFDRDDDRLAVAKRRLDEEQKQQVERQNKLNRVSAMQDSRKNSTK